MLHIVLEFFRALTNPPKLIELLSTLLSGWLGYTFLACVVFAETGLAVGVILPGDSLLFTVGVVAGAGSLNIVLVNVLLMAAAMAGDSVGYWVGRKTGPRIFSRPDSRFFKQEYLERTREFYQKHGGRTIIYARYIPIIRTFAPFVAGIGQMKYARFLAFNIPGDMGWVLLFTLLGYFLGGLPFVQHYFDKVILGIIFLSLMPTVIELLKVRRKRPA